MSLWLLLDVEVKKNFIVIKWTRGCSSTIPLQLLSFRGVTTWARNFPNELFKIDFPNGTTKRYSAPVKQKVIIFNAFMLHNPLTFHYCKEGKRWSNKTYKLETFELNENLFRSVRGRQNEDKRKNFRQLAMKTLVTANFKSLKLNVPNDRGWYFPIFPRPKSRFYISFFDSALFHLSYS